MKFKKKKVVKLRGSKTHGHGSKKKRRGAGNKGGKGLAGTGKRADQKKPSVWKSWQVQKPGKHGFKPPRFVVKRKKLKAINVSELSLLAKQLKSVNENLKELNLKLLGFKKLLGRGLPSNDLKSLKIIVESATSKAVEKLSSIGCDVVVLEKQLASKLSKE